MLLLKVTDLFLNLRNLFILSNCNSQIMLGQTIMTTFPTLMSPVIGEFGSDHYQVWSINVFGNIKRAYLCTLTIFSNIALGVWLKHILRLILSSFLSLFHTVYLPFISCLIFFYLLLPILVLLGFFIYLLAIIINISFYCKLFTPLFFFSNVLLSILLWFPCFHSTQKVQKDISSKFLRFSLLQTNGGCHNLWTSNLYQKNISRFYWLI